jgi:hypothetical protein
MDRRYIPDIIFRCKEIVSGMRVLFRNKEYDVRYFDADDMELGDFLTNMNKKEFEEKFYYDNTDSGIFIGIKKIGKINFLKAFDKKCGTT